jgi:hypothetical protein
VPLVRIDLQKGRTQEELRKLADTVAAYAELAKRLETECGVRPEDLIISVMANRHVDWSFGVGQAQFLDGTLTSVEKPGSLSGQRPDGSSEEQYVPEGATMRPDFDLDLKGER